VIIVVLCAVFFAWRGYLKHSSDIKDITSNLKDSVDLQLDNVHMRETDTQGNRYEMKASKAGYYVGGKQVHLQNVVSKIWLSSGEVLAIKGENAILDTNNKTMEFFGGVELQTDKGTRLLTKRLFYNNAQRRIYSDDDVTIEGQTMKMTGKGVEFLLAQQELKLLKNIKAEVRR
ncbi:MAG: LPS export ABC transporter periplasmic protein LptC, partial [Deltaproteobacteria bacterium]